jgi:hypothetical protein
LTREPRLWSDAELPEHFSRLEGPNFKSLRFPLWTQNKARLIQAYLQLFVYITRHGTYIDGFAAPQDGNHLETWAAKLVLEMEPKRIRDFWLCDLSRKGVKKLEELQAAHISLRGMNGLERARMVATRFEEELGYGRAEVFPIHDEQRGGRVLYHMIHGSDHPEALALMVRAYRKVSGHPDWDGQQVQLDLLRSLHDIQASEPIK